MALNWNRWTNRPGWVAWAVVVPLGLEVAVPRLAAQVEGRRDVQGGATAVRLRAMREIAEGVAMEMDRGGARVRVAMRDEPIYRFNDPARQFSDGTVWAWTISGRPVALLTVSSERTPEGIERWLC